MKRFGALLCLGVFLSLAARGAPVELVFGDPGSPRALKISAAEAISIPVPESAPLGSLWKLFVHVYLETRGQETPDYRCTGANPAEEVYCCAPGGSIARDAALAQSCGLYFSPERLGIRPGDWRAFWRHEAPGAPDWLFELDKLRPATEVPVASILAALDAIDREHRPLAALQRVSLEERARPLLSHLGNGLRVKTWSWRDSQGRRRGGFGGWLADGSPVWLRGSGSSAQVIANAAPWLVGHLPAPAPFETACVRVRFFTRYPLAEVLVGQQPAPEGPLRGQVEARFQNGQVLVFKSGGDLVLDRSEGRPQIGGRFGMNDYLARVLTREASVQPREAARALVVAARTYLVRHAGFGGGCYEIDDDSRRQRVSPAPPGSAALALARWSDPIILSGAEGRYHQTRSGPQQLSWQAARTWAAEGQRWDEILTRAYGAGGFSIVGMADAGECQTLALAEAWLAARQALWKRKLSNLPGFEPPSPPPRVCRLTYGNPYADIERGRIYATGIGSPNERLSLTHEYLHFAFAHHPRGMDEDFVEQTARALLGLQ